MCSRSTSPTKRDTLRLRRAACTRVHAAVSLSRVMVTFFIGRPACSVRGRTYYTGFVYLGVRASPPARRGSRRLPVLRLARALVRCDRLHVFDALPCLHPFPPLGQGDGATSASPVSHVEGAADELGTTAH